MTTTSQKMIWEVRYCVRRVDKTSLCLGDILLSCAIEEVRNRAEPDTHRASTFIWLVLAGGFSNLPALRVYLLHGFEVIGFHKVENEVLMAVCNVGDDNTRRALKQVTGKLKSTFLLPVLKKAATIQAQITCMAPTCMAPNVWHQMYLRSLVDGNTPILKSSTTAGQQHVLCRHAQYSLHVLNYFQSAVL